MHCSIVATRARLQGSGSSTAAGGEYPPVPCPLPVVHGR
jgi:hypothetical protein